MTEVRFLLHAADRNVIDDLPADVARTLALTRLREAAAEGAFDLALLADKRNPRLDGAAQDQPELPATC